LGVNQIGGSPTLTYLNNGTDTIYGIQGGGGIAVHPTNNKLYVAGNSGNIGVANVAGSAVFNTSYFAFAPFSLVDVAISPDGGKLYVSGAYHDEVGIANISPGDGLLSLNNTVSAPGTVDYGRLTLAPSGNRLYMSRYCASAIDYMNTSGTPEIASFSIQYNGNTYGQRDIAVTDDGSIAFVRVGDSSFHTIVVLDTSSGTIIGTIELPACEANSIVFKF